MANQNWKSFRLFANLSMRGIRLYGTTNTGPRRVMALAPRGLQPGPRTNPKLLFAAVVVAGLATFSRYYAGHLRENVIKTNYETIVNSNYAPWRDFDNRRVPKFARVLANESPCGDSFKEAYLCANWGKGSCEDKFSSFLSCLDENPVMLRDVKPNGEYNWGSKLFLHNLLHERKAFEDLLASVGPAEEDMEDVYDSYRARELLGANVSEDEVKAFKEKFAALRNEFYAEVQALFDGEKTDAKRADELLKLLIKDYAIPGSVWLQVMKDYDLEEFDDAITYARKLYVAHLDRLVEDRKTTEVRDVDLSGVTCGDQFEQMYQCVDNKKDAHDCLDFVDELYFCEQQFNKEVWHKTRNLNLMNHGVIGTDIFVYKDQSFKDEFRRVRSVLGYNGTAHGPMVTSI